MEQEENKKDIETIIDSSNETTVDNDKVSSDQCEACNNEASPEKKDDSIEAKLPDDDKTAASDNSPILEEPKSDEAMPPPPPGDSFSRNNEIKPPSPGKSFLLWAIIIAIVGFTISGMMNMGEDVKEIGVSELNSYISEGKISSCEIIRETDGSTFLQGAYKESEEAAPVSVKCFTSPNTETLEQRLEEKNINFKHIYKKPSLFTSILIQILPFVLIFAIFYFFMFRKTRDNPMNFGKSRAHRLDSTGKKKITFKNVAGVDEAKEEVKEIVEFLKAPQRFAKLGGRIPRGVLLVGPPGTGKTLLAKAIAGEAGVPFFSISGSDFVEMFVGVGASRVRNMFETAKKNSPCIIFIDEIDAVGRSRFTGIGGGHDEREQTLNALLVEMDGFESTDGVIVMAATNRPDVLDKALLRPGRFDRQVVVDLPTMEGREQILKIHAEKLAVSESVDFNKVARGTPGFSGADLANLLNEAALHAAAGGKEAIEQDDLEEARDKVWWGRERPGRMKDKEEKRLTAYHEAGHAVVMALVKDGEPLHKITIIPRGMALGATMFLPKKDRVSYTRNQMLAMLATDMGGRVAEEIFLDDISSGAQQDLRQATSLAHQMVCDWGMSEALGPRTFGAREEMMFLGREVGRQQDYSEATAQKIDAEVGTLINNAYQTAHRLLEENRDKVELLVAELLEKETLDGEYATNLIKFGKAVIDESVES